jgi:hypothetical protein
VYLSVGLGRHVDEVRFSILSAARHLRPDSEWRIVLYADDAEPFADLPVEVVRVESDLLAEWVGSQHYVWRAKVMALAEALAAPGVTRCLLVDGDTYFRRSPAEVVKRVAAGRSVMHMVEGWPTRAEVAALDHVLARSQPVDTTGRPWSFGPDRVSWNSGAVGLHVDDARLCREVVHLTDQLLEYGFGEHSHTAEQLAFAVCLDRSTVLRGCSDALVHYWRGDLRDPFVKLLRETWDDPALTPQEGFQRLWPDRPRERPLRRGKAVVKRSAWRMGWRVGVRS